jgi:PmbA protein
MDYDKIADRINDAFDSWELFFLKEKSKKYECRDKELYSLELKEEEGISMRAIKDSRMVFSYTFENSDNAAEILLENSKILLPFVEQDNNAGFPGRCETYPFLDIYDNSGITSDDNYKTELLIDMEKTILDFDKRIVATRNCELQDIDIHATIMNSNGLKASSKKTLFTLFAMAVARSDDEVSWYDWLWGNAFAGINLKNFGSEVARKTVSFLSSKQIDTGIYEGVLTPRAASDMLEILSQSFLGENKYKDKTKLKGKENTKYFSEVLTIFDSGLKGMDSFPFDGEGVSSGERCLVENGYIKSFLYDNYYGRKFGMQSTGNSVRSGVKEPPKCAQRCFYIENGRRDVGRLITDGIIIEELMGTHTANPVTGDFSLGAAGYLCKNGGKLPFNGVIFSGNIFELLNNVKEVGNDVKFYGTCGSPSIYVEDIKISGK